MLLTFIVENLENEKLETEKKRNKTMPVPRISVWVFSLINTHTHKYI